MEARERDHASHKTRSDGIKISIKLIHQVGSVATFRTAPFDTSSLMILRLVDTLA